MLGFYNTKRRPAKAATTMVEAMAKSPVPGLPMTIVAAEDPDGFETLLVPLEVAALVPAVAAALPDVVVLAVCVTSSAWAKRSEKKGKYTDVGV
jgi:hypothetical protein